MEKFFVGAGSNFVNDSGFEVEHDGPRDVVACKGLSEEGSCRIVSL